MRFAAIIVAAGSGSRAGEGPAKQWRRLAGRPVLRWSVETLLRAGATPLILVVQDADRSRAEEALHGLNGWRLAAGGASRTSSVRAGLAEVPDGIDAILVHDAARPFVRADHVQALLEALERADGALPGLAVADTLKRLETKGLATLPRDGVIRAQTPQAFRRAILMAAYAALPLDTEATDDAGVVEAFGGHVVAIPGDPALMKLTYPEDFTMAEALAGLHRIVRTGQGFDAHRWGPGEAVWLCGVRIDHDQSLIGHSDADAGLHAVTDAILGAIGQGDIGDHFPPSDPRWKGAASSAFLAKAAELVTGAGGRILNVDLILICERPKIAPHRAAMRDRLAALLGLPVDRISVKATTTEGMGFTGRGEGLAAQAIATVEMPI